MILRKFSHSIKDYSGSRICFIVICAATGGMGLAILAVCIFKNFPYLCSDLIIGDMLLRDQSKAADYIIFPAFYLGTTVSLTVLLLILQKNIPRNLLTRACQAADMTVRRILKFKKFFLLFVSAAILGLLLTNNFHIEVKKAFVVYGVFLAAFVTLLKEKSFSRHLVHLLLLNLFLYYGLQGVWGIVFRYYGDSLPSAENFMLWTAILINAALLGLMLRTHEGKTFRQSLNFLMRASQIFIPLNLLSYLNITVTGSAGAISYPLNPALRFPAIISIALSCLWISLKVLGPASLRVQKYGNRIFLPSVLTLAFLFWFPGDHIPTIFPFLDFFHLGELTNPFHHLRVRDLHHADYVPTLGLIGVYIGAFNSWAFEGRTVTHELALTISMALPVLLTAGLAWFSAGSFAALLIAVIMKSISVRFIWVLAISILLFTENLVRRKEAWLFFYGLISVLHFSWHAPIAIGLAAAFLPFAFIQYRNLIREHGARHGINILLLVILLTGFSLYFFKPAWSNFQFYLLTSRDNILAYGIPIDWTADLKQARHRGFLLAGSLLSVLILLGMGLFNIRPDRKITANEKQQSFSNRLVWIGIFFMPGIFPYAMGRIDAFEIDRLTPVATCLYLGFIPLALLTGRFRHRRAFFGVLLTIILLLGMTHFSFRFKNPGIHPSQLTQHGTWFDPGIRIEKKLGGNFSLIDGPALGLPALGTGYFKAGNKKQKEKLALVQTVKAVLDRFAPQGETFFDFSNRPALYFILDRYAPGPHASTYTTMNGAMQQRMIENLKRKPPAVVLIRTTLENGLIWNPAGRTYRVFRHLLLAGYQPYEQDRQLFLIRKDRAPVLYSPQEITASLLKNKALHNFKNVPNVWGRNWSRLKHRFTGVPVETKPASDGWYRIEKGLAGANADFLRVSLPQSPAAMQGYGISWKVGKESEQRLYTLRFKMNQKEALIPAGMHPGWLLAEDIRAIRFFRLEKKRKIPLEKYELEFKVLVK